MGKFLKRAMAVIVAFVVLDFAFGLLMDAVTDHAKGGDTYNSNYINRHFSDSLAIFGSSRANHHYVSKILEDSLNLPSYNCGMDGNGVLLAYCFLNNIIARGKTPSVIVYDFFPKFDLYENGDHQQSLSRIKPFYNIEGMKEIIDDLSDNEYFKLHLGTYRYNSEFIQMISDAISPKQVVVKGYKPIYEKMTIDFVKSSDREIGNIDSLKVKYFHKFVDLCNKHSIELVFVVSPMYFGPGEQTDYRHLLDSYVGSGLRLIDMSNDSLFVGHKDLFTDPAHMNNDGAEIFTSMLVDSIKKIIRLPAAYVDSAGQ